MPHRVLFSLMAMMVILAGCGGGPAYDALPSTEELMRADRQWSRGEVDAALASLKRILEQDSRSFPARYRLGVLHVHNEPRVAIGMLEQAAALAPDHPGPRFFTGLARRRLSDFEGVDRDLREAATLARVRSGIFPVDPSDTVLRGLDCLDRDDPNGAVDVFAEALTADSTDAAVWYLHGRASLRAGLVAQGEQGARRALALRPGFAEAHVLLARGLASEGRAEGARTQVELALAERPALASAHYQRGRLLLADQEFRDAALALWIAVLEDPTRPEHHSLLGRIMMRMSLSDQGTIHLHQAEALQAFLKRELDR